MTNTDAERVSDIVAALHRSITTASNDDLSEPTSDKRSRHVARITAMSEALDIIEAQSKALAEARGWNTDMEAAPKDGTRVILAWNKVARVGYYLDNSHTQKPWQGWKVPSMEEWPSGQPTAWMPFPRLTSEGDAPPTESILHPLADREKSADTLMDQATAKRRYAAVLITDAEVLEQLAYDTAGYCGGGEP